MTIPRTCRALPAGFLALVAPALGQWSNDPSINLVIDDGSGQQVQPKIVPTPDGGFYVSWFDNSSGGYDVRLQRLNFQGYADYPAGGVLIADRGFSSTQDYGLAVHSSGDALLTFRDDRFTGTQITATRVDRSTGAQPWGAAGVQLTSTNQFVAAPRVTGTTDGGVVVAWTQDANAQITRLDETGSADWSQTLVPSTGSFSPSDIHAALNGESIVSIVHQIGAFGSPRHILAHKFDANGNLLWGPGVYVFDGGSLQFGNFPPFIPDGSGGAVFGWYSNSPSLQCYAQHLLSDGTEAFPHNGSAGSTDASQIRVSPSVGFDPVTSETLLFWTDLNLSQSMSGVGGQKFDSVGARQWTDDGVTLVPLGSEVRTSVQTLAVDSGAMVFWLDESAVDDVELVAARVDASGSFQWGPLPACDVTSGKGRLRAAHGTTAQAALVWEDGRVDGGVYAQNVNEDGTLGTPAAAIYCDEAQNPNNVADIAVSTTDASAPSIFVTLTNGPPNQFLYLLVGNGNGTVSQPPGAKGDLCVVGGSCLGRYDKDVGQISAGGTFSFDIKNAVSKPCSGTVNIDPGATWNFQWWHRQSMGQPATFSSAIRVTFD